jgi:integrase
MKDQQRLTDRVVRDLPPPANGARITYDADVAGFGARVTAGGARSYVLNYRTRAGRERRYTIGSAVDWQAVAARRFASDLRQRIRSGYDPLAELEEERAAPTIHALCDRFARDYLDTGKLRPATIEQYRSLMDGPANAPKRGAPRATAFEGLRKAWGPRKVEGITFADVEALHARVTHSAPYLANRLVALLSRLFNLAIRWGWRSDNPTRGIERNAETKRQRFLRPDEIAALTAALAECPDQQAANIVRLLILTGSRRNEVLAMRWDQLDLGAGVWTKPGHTTKQKTEHRVPLSAPARQILAALWAERPDGDWVFPGLGDSGHREGIKSAWPSICQAAGIAEVRVHDLRHTYASVLASAGLSLPIIGQLLGHTQTQTTARYAHLLDDPLRAATERVGAIVAGGGDASVVEFGR